MEKFTQQSKPTHRLHCFYL